MMRRKAVYFHLFPFISINYFLLFSSIQFLVLLVVLLLSSSSFFSSSACYCCFFNKFFDFFPSVKNTCNFGGFGELNGASKRFKNTFSDLSHYFQSKYQCTAKNINTFYLISNKHTGKKLFYELLPAG